MSERAEEWLAYAKEDLAAVIHREGDHERTHDLIRLYRRLDIPGEYQSVLEDLNPADTAARYPDADRIDLDHPERIVTKVGDLLEWIQTRLNG